MIGIQKVGVLYYAGDIFARHMPRSYRLWNVLVGFVSYVPTSTDMLRFLVHFTRWHEFQAWKQHQSKQQDDRRRT
jgi:hypothetical protein